MSNEIKNESQQTQIDFNKIGATEPIDPFTNQPEHPDTCEIDTKKPIGQYSESVRILIADMQSKDSSESKLSRAHRLLGLSREVESNRTRRELKLLALDLDPDCVSKAYRPKQVEYIDTTNNDNIKNYILEKTKYETCIKLWPDALFYLFRNESNDPNTFDGRDLVRKGAITDIPTYDNLIEYAKELATKEKNAFAWKIYSGGNILRARGIIKTQDLQNNIQNASLSQSNQESQQSWQAPTVPTGASGAVRKPVAVRQMPMQSMPMGHPKAASVKQAPVSKTAQSRIKQINDPASNVLASKQEDMVISWVAKQYSDTCFSILDKYCGFVFGKGFYPYPSNPIQEFQTDDGVLVRVLILTSATVTFNNNRHFIHYEIDGELIKTNHPSILKNEKNIPCEYYADADRIPEGEKRCVRALRYRDGAIIRYWLHEIGGKDITEGAAYYKVRDSNIIEITFGQYLKEMHKMGKKLNMGQ